MHYILTMTDPDRGIPGLSERKKNKNVGGRKKIEGKFHEFYNMFGGFNIFSPNRYVIAGDIYGMSEEKIK